MGPWLLGSNDGRDGPEGWPFPVQGGELALTLTRGKASLVVKNLEGHGKHYPLTQRFKKETWQHPGLQGRKQLPGATGDPALPQTDVISKVIPPARRVVPWLRHSGQPLRARSVPLLGVSALVFGAMKRLSASNNSLDPISSPHATS